MSATYQELLLTTRKTLEQAEISSAGLEARLIVAKAAGKSADELMRDIRMYADTERVEAVEDFVRRRLNGEPLAYIIGEWGFMGHIFEITHDTLIPRSDTELLCETAIAALPKGGKLLDLCCGSGCIGLAALKEREDVSAALVELSKSTLAVAKRNARKLGVSARAFFLSEDATMPLPEALGEFDVVVSNPPYIPVAEIETLDHSVKDFEPHLALDGGDDGLNFYRSFARNLKRVVKPGGLLAVEVGMGQALAVAELFRKAGWQDIEILPDLNGIDRVVKCTLA